MVHRQWPQAADLDEARRLFGEFLDSAGKGARAVAFHDSDADGVTAAVVWQRALERAGFTAPLRLPAARERSAWSDASRARMAAAAPGCLFVLDLGSQEAALLPGVPTCLIDHHHPDGAPPGALLLSAYGWEPTPNTSLLTYELCRAVADVSDLDWIAAVGTISDLGERAPFELLKQVREKYAATHLKEVTALVNAARRASHYDPEAAAAALLSHTSPKDLLRSAAPEVAQLRAARAEVQAAMAEAKKAAPLFSGEVALVRVRSACQVHPLIAQIWRTRLPKYIVLAANDGYLPGRVNFSARSSPGTSVLQFLRRHGPAVGDGTYGRGHDQASGGSLPTAQWNELLGRLGFPDSAHARP